MAAKVFEVGDVLPEGQIKISWNIDDNVSDPGWGDCFGIQMNGIFPSYYTDYIIKVCFGEEFEINKITISGNESNIMDWGEWIFPYTNVNGNHPYVIINTTGLSINTRTVYAIEDHVDNVFYWEEYASGYNITFEENGGTSVTDLTEQTALPNPLPTTTRLNHVFAGWYLDSSFTQKAVAGATIESNVTLYAKWYTPTSWFSDVADAIREKEGTVETIEVVDFADRITALPITVEITQDDYDAISTKDSNTYYLIIDEE